MNYQQHAGNMDAHQIPANYNLQAFKSQQIKPAISQIAGRHYCVTNTMMNYNQWNANTFPLGSYNEDVLLCKISVLSFHEWNMSDSNMSETILSMHRRRTSLILSFHWDTSPSINMVVSPIHRGSMLLQTRLPPPRHVILLSPSSR